MRASLAAMLLAWSGLAGLGLVFAQLTQLQQVRLAGYPVVGWSYAVFNTGLAGSSLVLAVGALPLWLVMLRRARRRHSARDVAYLLTPVIVPVVFIVSLVLAARLVRHGQGVGPGWFAVLVAGGFVAAGLAASGPGVALRRLRPRGPAVRLATLSAALSAAIMILSAAASVVAAAGLSLGAPGCTSPVGRTA